LKGLSVDKDWKPSPDARKQMMLRAQIQPDELARKCHEELSHVTSVSELAAIARIPESTVRRWCTEGKLIAEQCLDGQIWLISLTSVNWVLTGQVGFKKDGR